MNTIFNLSADGKNYNLTYAYELPFVEKELYFRLIENEYVMDYSKLYNLYLKFDFEDGTTYTGQTYKVVDYNGEKVVEFKMTNQNFNKVGKVTITPTLNLVNKTIVLPEFKIHLLDKITSDTQNALDIINRLEGSVKLYLESIKRNEINQPNGVIGLDGNGKIPEKYINTKISEHIPNKLIDTVSRVILDDKGKDIGVNGLKFDNRLRLRYFDPEDDEHYIVNSIHGGVFGYRNKVRSWNVFGGYWSDIPLLEDFDIIDAGEFVPSPVDLAQGGSFLTLIENIARAGSFSDNFENIAEAGKFILDNVAPPAIDIVDAGTFAQKLGDIVDGDIGI